MWQHDGYLAGTVKTTDSSYAPSDIKMMPVIHYGEMIPSLLINTSLIVDIADGLVGVGLITSSEDMPGVLTLDKGYNEMSKFLNR